MTTTDTHKANVEYLASREMWCPDCGSSGFEMQLTVGGYYDKPVCSACNGTGRVPMFPMLRRECPHNAKDGYCYEVDYTDAPMNDMLGRIEQLGWSYAITPYATTVIRLHTENEPSGTSEKCTPYKRLCDALTQAVKAQEASE